MNSPAQNPGADLAQWIPRLLNVWRRAGHRAPGAPDRLNSVEAAQIAMAVQTLSQGLTRDRDLAGAKYFSDPFLLGAYLLYYWPLSYLQARQLLRTLPKAPQTVLDLGSGPGPVGAAAWDAGAKTVTFADRSQGALALVKKLAAQAGKNAEIRHWDPLTRPELPPGRFDCILAGHLLNELWNDEQDRVAKRVKLISPWLERLQPGGTLVLLDPALTSTSRDLMAVRDRLVAQGVPLLYPCLQPGPCPALNKPGETCHIEETWELPPLVRDLVRRLKFKKDALKMSAFIFGAPGINPPPMSPDIFRIVSDPLLSKNRRVRLLACGISGRLSLALKPELATPENRNFLTLRRGDVVRVTGAVPREGGLDLVPGSRVEPVSRLRPR
ncbi:MAG: methyltransferase domain-containing protein [Candidatus Firestonebacteria bacterium]|nr:methyltransferase domain-containing protein [Candidatus Firestonebacteria bacterium]